MFPLSYLSSNSIGEGRRAEGPPLRLFLVFCFIRFCFELSSSFIWRLSRSKTNRTCLHTPYTPLNDAATAGSHNNNNNKNHD